MSIFESLKKKENSEIKFEPGFFLFIFIYEYKTVMSYIDEEVLFKLY